MNFKTAMNKYCGNYALPEDDVKHLKKIILMMLDNIHKSCEKHNIYYCLAYGSVLGQARHGGFIPWDDDIDIFMYPNDLEKLEKALNEDYPEKYYVSVPGKVKHDPCRFGKVMLKGTLYEEIEYAGLWKKTKFERGIAIDIFLYENCPQNKLSLKTKKFFNKVYGVAASTSMDFKYPSPILLDICKENKDFRRFYNKRRFIGFFFWFLPIHTWAKAAIRCTRTKPSEMVTFNYCAIYGKFVLPKKLFDETEIVKFENIEARMMKDYETYLVAEYGDWRKIPKDADKERHIIAKIDFGSY